MRARVCIMHVNMWDALSNGMGGEAGSSGITVVSAPLLLSPLKYDGEHAPLLALNGDATASPVPETGKNARSLSVLLCLLLLLCC